MAPAPMRSNPEQDISFPMAGVMLQDGVSQLMVEPGALHCSSSPTTICLETQVPKATCSTYCLVRQPKVAPWPVMFSLPTPPEYSDQELLRPSPSRRIRSRVHVHRPMPWPSFMDVHATRDETRPRPWPSFISCCEGKC
jgi:hypothetical protein